MLYNLKNFPKKMIVNKKNYKVTVIVTYQNEEKNIEKTLNLILNQTYVPDEIIFIDSQSTDSTSEILDKKILLTKKKIRNIKNFKYLQSFYPSTSKNLGIQLAQNSILAFMDCGIKFSKDWLKKKMDLIINKNFDAVLGSCILSGINNFDRACVINTYGYKKKNLCIPGSVIKKNVFLSLGFFESSRSYYDVIWKNKLEKSKINFYKDYKNYIEYDGTNYAKNINSLYKKNIVYTSDTINIKKNFQTQLYILASIFSVFLFFFKKKFFFIFFLFYILTRFIIAKRKAQKKINMSIGLFVNIIYSALVIDFARVIGSFKSLFRLIGLNSSLSLFFFIYIVLFNSPMVSILSKYLINHQNQIEYKDASAVVVFSGGGNITFNSYQYKNRAIEAVIYSQNKNVKNIYLSSGRDETISDIELLKAFLLSKNTDPDKINIFEKFPVSTYENILMVGNKLKKSNQDKIIFLTTPIHTKRATLMWKKLFPEIKIATKENNLNLKWNYELREVSSVMYEYLAIMYNFLQGRI